jgi:hypothetical protein
MAELIWPFEIYARIKTNLRELQRAASTGFNGGDDLLI